MKKHLQKHKHHYIATFLVVLGLVLAYSLLASQSTLFGHSPVKPAYAVTYDSTASIIIGGEYMSQAPVAITSTRHSFGTCNSAPGQLFYISIMYTQCSALQFGPPDGVTIYMPQAPAGFYVSGWSVPTNATDGSVVCASTQCFMNYSSGIAYLEVDLNAITEPTPPNLFVTNTSANSISLQWTTGSPGSVTFMDYLFYFGSNWSPTSATSTTAAGLSCGTTYSFHVAMRTTAGNRNSNTVTSATSACPVATPSPSPSPSPKPSPSPSPAPPPASGGGVSAVSPAPKPIQGTASNAATNLQASDTQAADIVATPPTTPDSFTAKANQGSGTISLGWSDSSASSPLHYLLERSVDQVTWQVIDANIFQTTYSDSSPSFSTHYYYRLTAIDTAGLSSASTMADVTSGSFKVNVSIGRDITLVTKDGYVRVTIPAGALTKPANCSISEVTNVPLTGGKGQQTIGGPYEIICQLADTSTVRTFNRPLSVSVTLTPTLLKQYKNFEYQAYSLDKSSWQTIATKPAGSMKFKLTGSQMALTILAQEKHFPTWIIVVLTIIGVVGGGIVGLAFLGRIVQRKRLEEKVQDYWNKTNGG
ncbi:MAG: fibronectin type III domain-containing protein [Candidatus Saccharibacteria bacterium]